MYKGKVVIYTAIFGGKDNPFIPAYRCNGVKYVLFTDSDFKSKFWEVVKRPCVYDSRRTARMYKSLPHEFFPGHELSIWIDGRVFLRGDTEKWAREVVKRYDCAVKYHPDRKNTWEEADFCARKGYDNPVTIKQQVARYSAEGFNGDGDLPWTNVLIRMNTPTVERFNNLWWKEIKEWSLRDQISFAYCASVTGMRVKYLPIGFSSFYAVSGEHAKRKKSKDR